MAFSDITIFIARILIPGLPEFVTASVFTSALVYQQPLYVPDWQLDRHINQ
jgi:hypothetical protein